MAGMFLANGYPVTILFDSGASHTFISTACVVRNNLEFDHMEDEYHVKSPGGRIVTNQLVRDIALVVAPPNLIRLKCGNPSP